MLRAPAAAAASARSHRPPAAVPLSLPLPLRLPCSCITVLDNVRFYQQHACPPPFVAVLWQMSAQRKRQDAAARMEAGGGSGKQRADGAGLQPLASGKGDRFFSNLMPSFAKR